VILAVGESFDLDFARASGLQMKESGTIEVDRFSLETSRPTFYAGGDVISGASNVSNAMGYGKKAARNMDERLMGVHRWQRLFPKFEYEQTPPEQPGESRRHNGHHTPASARARNFDEVVLGLTAQETLDEACRCLRCDIKVESSR
jgi:NADH-quinone oxidoreductase subunit F